MMDNLFFRNTMVIDPDGKWNRKAVDVRISAGTIIQIAKGGSLRKSSGEKVLEEGSLSPGWIDMRVYLTDPGEEWKDDLSSLNSAALAGGFTGIVCIPVTNPMVDCSDIVQSVKSRSAKLPVSFYVAGAITEGAKGKDLAELFDMKRAGAIAFTDGIRPVRESGVMLRGLQYASSFGGLLMSFPLDMSISGEAQVNEGKAAATIGMKGTPNLAEEMLISRDLRLHEYFPGRLHFAPVTTSGGIDSIKSAKKKGQGISAETSAHYLAFDDSVITGFDVNHKVFPPLRGSKDVSALRRALKDGTIDAVSSGHYPQAEEDKKMEFSSAAFGAIGLQTCFSLLNTELVETGDLELGRLVELLSKGPRKILGLPSADIREGAKAVLTHFDEKQSWTYQPETNVSRSRNSPLFGREFRGRSLGIVSRGKYYPAF